MNKKIISLLLASSLLVSIQLTGPAVSPAMAEAACTNVDNLVDVTPNHWAFDPVRLVTQEWCVMPPKTPTRFAGNDVTTRYEVANVFYNAARKLESVSGKDLKVTEDRRQVTLTDVDAGNTGAVNSVVNEYGIMQAMPGNKFMGQEKMSRYELAFELNNYLNLLEKKVGRTSLDPVNRTESFTDVKEDHWATPAVRNIVNKYQIMVGYPDNSFRGYQTLTRYELAAVLRRFFDYVDRYLIPIGATPAPTAVPTLEPTPMPTMEPTPLPTIAPERPPLSMWDIKLGGTVRTAYTGPTNNQLALLYGPSGALNLWFGDTKRVGIGLHGEYLFYSSTFENTTRIPGLARLTYGGDLNWRVIGEYADDIQFILGAGYGGWHWLGNTSPQPYVYINHGPYAKGTIEFPIGGALSLFVEDTFQYFVGHPRFANGNLMFNTNTEFQNDLFAGVNIPAYTGFSIQLGYKDVKYKLSGNPSWYGDIGGLANVRIRF